nr:MAG2-interacting protein 2 [Ipomoea batatas]
MVALRSTQLVSAISPSIEVTPEDLLTVEAAVSCFVKICSSAVSISHVNTLLDILREWEGLFSGGKVEADSGDGSDGGNSWGNDDWDEGWESFQEDPVQPEPKKDDASFSIHPLHVCWMEIFKKLLMLSQFQDMLKLIDQSNAKSNEVLLDEDGARSLSQIALDIDYLLSLKLMLLFPYKAVQLQCLDAVEHKLKHEGISDQISGDHQFLVLVLSSGVISTIITNSSYGTVFSCICYMVGNLSRQCQESQSSKIGTGGSVEGDNIKDMVLFTKLVFPCFISELVSAEQQILAGLLVTKFMHTNASVSLLNIAGASLRKYLETQIQILPGIESSLDNTHSSELLVNTLSSLKGKLGSLMQSSLSVLPVDG